MKTEHAEMNSENKAPWQLEDCFPEKPPGQDYGYLENGKLIACSQAELIPRCSSLDLSWINLVWHPDTTRLVTISAVPFLREALRIRAKAQLKQSVKGGTINLFLFGTMAVGARGEGGYFIVLICLAVLEGAWPLISGLRQLRRFDETTWEQGEENVIVHRYAVWIETRSTVVTFLILGLITIVLIVEAATEFPQSVQAAGLVKKAVWHGDWWRLGTAPFLHGNIMHFMFNATALIGLGQLMEGLASRFYLALVFGLAAVGGSLFSLFLIPNTDSVGASGGLLGLIGFLLVLGCHRKSVLPPGFVKSFVINIAIIAVMGALAYSLIDNAAHLGGFLVGAAAGALLVPPNGGLPLAHSVPLKIAGVMATILIVVAPLFAVWKILER